MKLKGVMEVEVLKDTTGADAAKKAARRMELICQSGAEVQLSKFAPNEAMDNSAPGYPCADYGSD